jgi:signal transduction histidine kinase
LGHLVVGPRTPGEPLAAADRRVLDDVGRLAALAARSATLADELQRSRQRIVTSREEERRRLRRDLHDGLGPTLAGVALRVEAGLREHGDDPAIKALLTAVQIDIHAATAGVRHAVYDLRPPALDEFGLRGALQRQADSLAGTVTVAVDADNALVDLPPRWKSPHIASPPKPSPTAADMPARRSVRCGSIAVSAASISKSSTTEPGCHRAGRKGSG